MAGGFSRRQIKTFRGTATLIAIGASLFQGLIAFGSLKAQAWSLNDTGQGIIVLMLVLVVLAAMALATMAMLVSPETATFLGIGALVLDLVIVTIALRSAADPTGNESLTNAGLLIAPAVVMVVTGVVLTKLEGGRIRFFG
ncbi:MAG TPA: hypothetical protein VGR22_04750 [Thermomicrobiales bacterium]|nr:hypothetical protein [Thermomicrobiales bacterium]